MLGFDSYCDNKYTTTLYPYRYMGMADGHDSLDSPLPDINDLFLHKAKMHKTADGELSDRHSIFIHALSAIRLRP